MVVDSHREHAFGLVLTNNVVIQDFANVTRGGDTVSGFDQTGLMFFTDDVHAKFDAFITNEYGWSGNQLADLVLAFSAERTVQRVLGITARGFAHEYSDRKSGLVLAYYALVTGTHNAKQAN